MNEPSSSYRLRLMLAVTFAGALLLAARLSGQAEFPLSEAWRHWRYSAPVEPPAGHSGLVAVVVTPAVTAHAQPHWADLRVADDTGREIPFVLHSVQDRRSVEPRAARLLEVSFLPGESTQGIVDLGENPPEHNSLEVQINRTDYFLWVEVAISSNARSWRILNERSPVYRFSASGLDGNQTIRYFPSRSRYLRIRLLEGKEKLPLDGVRVAQEVRREAERTPLETPLQPDPAAPVAESWWLADLGSARLPLSEVRFTVEQAEFHRAVRVRTSDDGKIWRTAGHGDIYRISPRAGSLQLQGEDGRERLRIRLPETQARFWRVEVLNRNDPPLVGARLQLLGTPRRMIFRVEAGRSYRLLMGHPRATDAQYEMARLTPEKELEAAVAASLGAIAVNPAWADPAPWTERHSYLLWIALLAAAAIIGLLALRALRG
jgi:hypothetical protein